MTLGDDLATNSGRQVPAKISGVDSRLWYLIIIAPDGRVLEIEEEVSMNDLPASVRDALKKKANSGTITKIESLTKGNKLVAYEAQLRNGAKRSEIQVGPQGEPLARPE